jgi:cyclic beta-1,2-glucan synthetase
MYQAGVESILGFRLRGTTLLIDPCIPRAWPGFEIDFRYHTSRYEIVVENPQRVCRGVASAELDGRALTGEGAAIPLADDGTTHRVKVVLGWASPVESAAAVPATENARPSGSG